MNPYSRKKSHNKGNIRILVHIGSMLIVFLLMGAAQAKPEAKFDRELIDLGIVDRNSKIEKRTISVTNTGTDVLTLKFFASTCGCVSLAKISSKIAPGDKGIIELRIDPKKLRTGSKMQRIVFATNDPKRPHVPIKLIWRSKREPVRISPTEISLELSPKELQSLARTSHKIFVLDAWDKHLKISDISTSDNFTACLYDIIYRCPTGSEAHVFRFGIRMVPVYKTGTVNGWVKFSTNHPDFTTVTIPITYNIRSNIRVVPKTLIFNDLAGKDSVKTIRIKSLNKKVKLEIEEIIVRDPWLSVKQIRVSPNIIDLNVSKLDTQSNVEKDNRRTFNMLKASIIIRVAKPEEIEHIVNVISIH